MNLLTQKPDHFLRHTWAISDIDSVLTQFNNHPIVLHSKPFPSELQNQLQFSLRLVVSTDDFKEHFISLFLHLEKLHLSDDSNVKIDDIDVYFEFSVLYDRKIIYTSPIINKIFRKHNCFGIQQIIPLKQFLTSFQPSDQKNNPIMNITCKATLRKQFKELLNYIFPDSFSKTSVGELSTRFSTEIVIKKFPERIRFSSIESDFFSPPGNYDIKFSLVLEKWINSDGENFIALFLKLNSKNTIILPISWRVSILSWNKQPFVTGGNVNFYVKIYILNQIF